MALATGVSLVLSSVIAVLIFSLMQLYKPWLSSTQISTILGGFIGSWLFIISLTAVSNLETVVLGEGFQAKLFPEIIFCLISTLFICGSIHRVCATTGLLFSILGLYYVHKISQKVHNIPVNVDVHSIKKKKK